MKKIALIVSLIIFASCSASKNTNLRKSQSFKVGSSKYYENYAYVDEARGFGNAGFSAIEIGNGDKAKALLTKSTLRLAEGARGHSKHVKEKIKKRQTTNKIVSGALQIGLVALGVRASRGQQQAQLDKIKDSVVKLSQNVTNIANRVDARILQQEKSNLHSDAQSVDIGIWRTAVVSNHPIAKSVVSVTSRSGERSCTGFFIQPRVVATAAHCIDDTRDRIVQRQVPESGEAFMKDQTEDYSVLGKYYHPRWDTTRFGRSRPIAEYTFDVGLLIVDRPSKHWLKMDLSTQSVGSNLMIMGYSSDLNDGYFLRLDYGCKIQSVTHTNKINRSNCASYPGNSGGPVLSLKNGSPRVTSITSFGPSNKSDGARRDGNNGSVSMNVLASVYREAIINHPNAGNANLFN